MRVTWDLKLSMLLSHQFSLLSFPSRFAVKLPYALNFKLCLTGIPIYGPCDVLSDSNSVFKNSLLIELTLKEKCRAFINPVVNNALD